MLWFESCIQLNSCVWMIQEQLDNIFASFFACQHESSISHTVFCIKIDVFTTWMVQEQFDNIFVSIIASKHKCVISFNIACIQLNSFRIVQKQLDNISVSVYFERSERSAKRCASGVEFKFFFFAYRGQKWWILV